ncbi:MAG: 1-acyl-sn-glycerol-3-phosphate acyltransferase [Sphingomonadaceae bacterium]|nr:1-acyl-sn-glycerol-3-phosphate acyltransferase [Sphingomonadaceae bacterium]
MMRLAIFALTRFLVGGHPRWQGSEPSGRQRIYFANHGSHLDTVLLWSALPGDLRDTTHPVAAADYWGRHGLSRYFSMNILNAVLIERKAPRGTDPLEPLRDVLDKGESLIIFPEGTRGNEILPGPFKSGLYHLAQDYPDAELIPVYLENLSRAWPKGAWIPVPISCSVRFGPPIALVEGQAKADFLERARNAVVELA